MKEFMPDTHITGSDARAYAAGELSFDAIAEDRGPRLDSTIDMYMSQIPAYGWSRETWSRKREIEPYERKLTKAEEAALAKLDEDNIVFEGQLVAQTYGPPEEDEEGDDD